MNHRSFFTDADRADLEKTIAEAEAKTSGEIRVHVEGTCQDAFERAKTVFEYLRMHETNDRSGVLFYLAVEDRSFAVLGDRGIDARVPKGFWDATTDLLSREFKLGHFTEGLKLGIASAGEHLAAFFPRKPDDTNELTNAISFGER